MNIVLAAGQSPTLSGIAANAMNTAISRRATMNKKPLHPRLVQLNEDMAIQRHRDICEVTAARGGFRFKITVLRHASYGFVATTKINGRLQMYSGRLPSDAFQALTRSLTPTIRRMEAEKAEAEFAVNGNKRKNDSSQ